MIKNGIKNGIKKDSYSKSIGLYVLERMLKEFLISLEDYEIMHMLIEFL